jgi:hypothetical protein
MCDTCNLLPSILGRSYTESHTTFLIAFSFPLVARYANYVQLSKTIWWMSRVHIVIITGVYAIVACILLSAIVFGFI